MTRRGRRVVIPADRPEWGQHLSGVMATFTGTCPRCDGPIIARQSQVVKRRESWIHVGCAPGADE